LLTAYLGSTYWVCFTVSGVLAVAVPVSVTCVFGLHTDRSSEYPDPAVETVVLRGLAQPASHTTSNRH
jgi:hypothetical protein